jgi:tetratricopeptide (TPR) repeat protein
MDERHAKEAETLYVQSMALDPGNAATTAKYGALLSRQESQHWPMAETALMRARAIDNELTPVYVALGDLYVSMGSLAEAEAVYIRASRLQVDPEKRRGLMRRITRVQIVQGRLDDAERSCEEAKCASEVGNTPGVISSAQTVLGILRFQQTRREEALFAFKTALRFNPASETSRHNLRVIDTNAGAIMFPDDGQF